MVTDPPVILMSRNPVVALKGGEIELPRKAKVRIAKRLSKLHWLFGFYVHCFCQY